MLDNFVLFHIRESPWTIGGVSLALAAILLVVWVCLLPFAINRAGTVRRMSTDEAQYRSTVGRPNQPENVGKVLVAGPAAGVEWSYTLTIGGLRELRRTGPSFLFYALPAYAMLFASVFVVGGIGLTLLTRLWACLVLSGMASLLMLLVAFMMWASVYTSLE